MCSVNRLQVLTAGRNQLSMLPCDLANMVGLVFIDLRDNPNLSEVKTYTRPCAPCPVP
jgi:hypothetical protein